MSTLFTLHESWHQAPWLHERLAFASAGDTILLTQDAVLAMQSPLALASFLAKCEVAKVQVVALQTDCSARGISNQHSSIQLVDYAGFVKLVEQYAKQVAW